MKKINLLLLFIAPFFVWAQENPIDLEGYFHGKYVSDTLKGLKWGEHSGEYAYWDAKNQEILVKNAKTGKEVNRVPWVQKTPFEQTDYFLKNGIEVEEVFDSKSLYIFTKEGEDGYFVGSFADKTLGVRLCTDTGAHIVFGEPVHRSEWGIDKGWFLSPNGNYIAFYRMDESMVEDYPLFHSDGQVADIEWIKYPMAGRTSHQVTVGIFDAKKSFETNKPVYHYIQNDPSDGEFLTNVTFSPDEKYLYITHLNREQNHSKLIRYDVATGKKLTVLIEDFDVRYVEPQHRILFMKNGDFIYQSDRDGWNHCYLYSFDGQLLRQITKGNWEVLKLLGLDEKEENLYFVTNKDKPVDRYLYSLNLKSGKLINHTPESGIHTVRMSPDKKFFFDKYENLNTPLQTFVRSTDGKVNTLLLASENKYAKHHLGKDTLFTLKSESGDDLWCRMLFPPDFDPSKQYPCFVYVYGGPHSQLVTNSFLSGGIFLHYMAQRGYVVFTLDNRGTDFRGSEFEKCIHRQLGVLENRDQMVGINYLRSLPFVDEKRMGLDGWSFGGFMTLTMVTEHPDIFRCASCGGPVVNWAWYEVMYGERYMDKPQENPNGYENANIINKIKNLRCPLLVMHGMQDHTVIQKNTLELMHQSVLDDVQINYFPYTTHDHNVMGIDRVQMWHKIAQFHDLYLKR
ncbi:MAG: DPP IV N-terminal domain-containing protein [Bacteroidales bacterium]|nr:DPP IV N-terminal domain-containing protein [Bacteroidales bacterium]